MKKVIIITLVVAALAAGSYYGYKAYQCKKDPTKCGK